MRCAPAAALVAAALAAAWWPLKRFCAGGAVAGALLAKPLAGQVWVVTGANVGIGFETALQLARQNATVVLGCRNASRARDAAAAIRAAVPHGANVVPLALDLGALSSVDAFAYEVLSRFARLDGLVNNAGVMLPSPATRTADGFELQMGVNHLAHFYLTQLLTPRLVASAPSRVVIVSSRASEHGDLRALQADPDDWAGGLPGSWLANARAYCDSKLANALHARALAARLRGTGVVVAAVHPGMVRTSLFRDVPLLGAYADTLLAPLTHALMKSPWEGAQTTLYAALDDAVVAAHSGAYYSDARLVPVHANAQARDDALATRLWDASLQLVGLAGPGAAR